MFPGGLSQKCASRSREQPPGHWMLAAKVQQLDARYRQQGQGHNPGCRIDIPGSMTQGARPRFVCQCLQVKEQGSLNLKPAAVSVPIVVPSAAQPNLPMVAQPSAADNAAFILNNYDLGIRRIDVWQVGLSWLNRPLSAKHMWEVCF